MNRAPRPGSIAVRVGAGVALAIGLAVAGGSLLAAPDGGAPRAPEALSRELARAAERQDWEAAVTAARALVAARPDSALDAYNLACMLARSGSREEAVALLARSGELGFSLTSTLLRDEDLDGIREQPGFAMALDQIRRNNAAKLELAKPRLEAAPLLTYLPKAAKRGSAERVREPPPLVVALHGFGGTPGPIAEVYRPAAARLGAVLVAPRGQETVGQGFGWGVVEEAEYLVLKAIERTVAERSVGPIVLTGFSQGAGIALTLAARHPERFAGVVSVAGYFEERLAVVAPRVVPPFPRFIFLNGELDEAAANNRRAAQLLERAGVAVRLRIYPGRGHEFPPQEELDRELVLALRFALGS